MASKNTFENSAILLVSSEKGIYNWQHVAKLLDFNHVEEISSEDWEILKEGPDHPEYIDVLNDFLFYGSYWDESKRCRYNFHEINGGDIYLVPQDVEDVPAD